MWHIDSEHWTKGMSKFLWNTGVLTHDFLGGYSLNTEYKNSKSLQTVYWKLRENAGNLHIQMTALYLVPRYKVQVLVLWCTWREGKELLWLEWCGCPGHRLSDVRWVDTGRMSSLSLSINDFTLNKHLSRLLEWAPSSSPAFCSSNGIAGLRRVSCFNALTKI